MLNHPIKTQRLEITTLDERMAESMHENSLDADNRRFVPDEVFETVDAARDAITTLIRFYVEDDSPLVYAILLHDGQYIGHIQAVPFESGWEIGYHIGEAHTGNGYAAEAVGAFLPPIMKQLGILRIIGVCLAENMASRKVMEKCGFVLDFLGDDNYQNEWRTICRYSYTKV